GRSPPQAAWDGSAPAAGPRSDDTTDPAGAVLAVADQGFAIDDHPVHTPGVAHIAAAAAGDILDPVLFAAVDGRRAQSLQVGELAGGDMAAIRDLPGTGQLRGKALHRPLQGHVTALADKFLEQVAGVPGPGKLGDMGAGIGG